MPHNTGFTKAMLWSWYGTRRVLLCGSPQLTHQYTERSRQQGQVSEEGIRWQRSHFCSMHRNLHWGRPEKHEILHRMADKSITDVYWILWMKWSSLQQHSQANYKCVSHVSQWQLEKAWSWNHHQASAYSKVPLSNSSTSSSHVEEGMLLYGSKRILKHLMIRSPRKMHRMPTKAKPVFCSSVRENAETSLTLILAEELLQ